MQETRRARLQAVIQQELSVFVSREVKDPRIPPLTVTTVEVTPDAEQATVYISLFGAIPGAYDDLNDEERTRADDATRKRMKDCLAGLTSAQGFMRKHLARVLTIRHIPTLIFKEDRGLENSTRVFDLLRKIETEPKLMDDSGAATGAASAGPTSPSPISATSTASVPASSAKPGDAG